LGLENAPSPHMLTLTFGYLLCRRFYINLSFDNAAGKLKTHQRDEFLIIVVWFGVSFLDNIMVLL